MYSMSSAKTSFATGHVGINVTDVERSKRFYQEVFGWEIQAEGQEADKRFVFLGDDKALLVTLWQQSEGRFDGGRPGLHHLSFQVADIDAVHAAEARVRELGAKFFHDGVVPHREGASSGGIFFEDPDGSRLEIYAPAGADEQPAPSGEAPTCGFF
jgi:lactoylglutathione lyase